LQIYLEKLQAILEVAQLLCGALDLNHLLKTIVDNSYRLLHSQSGALFLVDRNEGKIVSKFQDGKRKIISSPLNCGIVGFTAEQVKLLT
jgi:hypothetical protein